MTAPAALFSFANFCRAVYVHAGTRAPRGVLRAPLPPARARRGASSLRLRAAPSAAAQASAPARGRPVRGKQRFLEGSARSHARHGERALARRARGHGGDILQRDGCERRRGAAGPRRAGLVARGAAHVPGEREAGASGARHARRAMLPGMAFSSFLGTPPMTHHAGEGIVAHQHAPVRA